MRKHVGGDEPPVRKMVQLTTVQAAWLRREAFEQGISEAAVVRQLVAAAMMEVK
jgi:hypothetical protein